MNDLEQMLRDALHDAPPVTPMTPDPVSVVSRRVRRIRLVLAGATAAAAVVVAVVVVPLANVADRGADEIQPLKTPTAGPSATALPAGTSVLWPTGADWVSVSPDGARWLTYTDSSGRRTGLAEVDADGQVLHQVAQPPAPADRVYAGRTVVWVVGSDDGGDVLSRVSAYSTSGQLIATKALPTTLLTFAVVTGDDLYVQTGRDPATDGVARFRVNGTAVDETDVTLPDHQGNGIAVTANGAVWADTEKHLVQVEPTGSGLRVVDVTGQWPLHGGDDANNPDAVWSADGSRLIELTPGFLSSGLSVSEGNRIPVSGTPQLAATDARGDLYVVTKEATLYAFAAATLSDGAAKPFAGVDVEGGAAFMVADPAGGVDYVTGDGRLLHWNPAH